VKIVQAKEYLTLKETALCAQCVSVDPEAVRVVREGEIGEGGKEEYV
jgi:hypothetical protein